MSPVVLEGRVSFQSWRSWFFFSFSLLIHKVAPWLRIKSAAIKSTTFGFNWPLKLVTLRTPLAEQQRLECLYSHGPRKYTTLYCTAYYCTVLYFGTVLDGSRRAGKQVGPPGVVRSHRCCDFPFILRIGWLSSGSAAAEVICQITPRSFGGRGPMRETGAWEQTAAADLKHDQCTRSKITPLEFFPPSPHQV